MNDNLNVVLVNDDEYKCLSFEFSSKSSISTDEELASIDLT